MEELFNEFLEFRNFRELANSIFLSTLTSFSIFTFSFNPRRPKFALLQASKGSGKSLLIKNFHIKGFKEAERNDKYLTTFINNLIDFNKIRKELEKYVDKEKLEEATNLQIIKAYLKLNKYTLELNDNYLFKIHEINAVGESLKSIIEDMVNLIDNNSFTTFYQDINRPIIFKKGNNAFINAILGMQEIFTMELSGKEYENYYSDRVFVFTLFNILRGLTPPIPPNSKIDLTFINPLEIDIKNIEIKRSAKTYLKRLGNELIEYSPLRRYNILKGIYNFIYSIIAPSFKNAEPIALLLLKVAYDYLRFYYRTIYYEGISEDTKRIKRDFLKVSTYIDLPIIPIKLLMAKRGIETLRGNYTLLNELFSLKESGYFDIIKISKRKKSYYFIIPKEPFYDSIFILLETTNLEDLVSKFEEPLISKELEDLTKDLTFKLFKKIRKDANFSYIYKFL